MGVILPISFFFVCPVRSVQCAITATDSSAEPVQTMPRETVVEYNLPAKRDSTSSYRKPIKEEGTKQKKTQEYLMDLKT